MGTKSRQSLDDVPSPAARPPSFTRNGAPSAPLPAAPAVEPEKLKSAARSMYYFQVRNGIGASAPPKQRCCTSRGNAAGLSTTHHTFNIHFNSKSLHPF